MLLTQVSLHFAGAVSLLPTILYLATEVLKESKGEPVVSEAGILLLQQCAECKRAALLPDTRERHAQLLQSALAKLVESVKTGIDLCNCTACRFQEVKKNGWFP